MKANKPIWTKPAPRGCKNPTSELHRYTIVRLSDSFERFTDRKPKRSPNQMIWDNKENREA